MQTSEVGWVGYGLQLIGAACLVKVMGAAAYLALRMPALHVALHAVAKPCVPLCSLERGTSAGKACRRQGPILPVKRQLPLHGGVIIARLPHALLLCGALQLEWIFEFQIMSNVQWQDLARQQAFEAWLAVQAGKWNLLPQTLTLAASDAGFRRYLRIQRQQPGQSQPQSCIIMDAPPDKEDCQLFVNVQRLLAQAQLPVPQILDWDEAGGFMLLNDLGRQTLLQWLEQERTNLPMRNDVPEVYRAQDAERALQTKALPYFQDAIETLVDLQRASRPGVLPVYDEAVLRRELQLFPQWYVSAYRQVELDAAQQQVLHTAFDRIVAENLAAPLVFVHRDFMPRNLMMPLAPDGSMAAVPPAKMGLLDFQDALHGPITYDIASLMRDAFWTWEEEFVIDITVRYWEKARKAGLLAAKPEWEADFGQFYRAVDWMALQRHLKVAGIFARLSLRDGKPRYLADTPRFIHYIRAACNRYRELAPLLRLVDQIEGIETPQAYSFGRM